MMNYATSGLNAVRTGLRLKRIGSTLLLIALPLSMLSMSLYIIWQWPRVRMTVRRARRGVMAVKTERATYLYVDKITLQRTTDISLY